MLRFEQEDSRKGRTLNKDRNARINVSSGLTLAGDWRYSISSKGFTGLAHFRALESDLICILFGASVPSVLRTEDDHLILIGEAYVNGLMHGEAIEMMQNEEVKVCTIDIW